MTEVPGSEEFARKSNAPKVVIGLLMLAVLGGTGAYVADRSDKSRKAQVTSSAFAQLSGCLLGSPLGAGEKPSVRVRAMQLSIAEESPAKMGVPLGNTWPFRCQASAQALVRVLAEERLSTPGADDLGAAVDRLAQQLAGTEQDKRLADLSQNVDALFAKAADKALTAVGTDAQAPKPAKPLLSLAALRKTKPLAQKPLPGAAFRGELQRHRDLAFAVADPSLPASLLCSLGESGDKLRCKPFPAPVAALGGDPYLHAARDPGAAPIVVFGPAASIGAYATDTGAAAIKGDKFGWAHHRKDGALVTLTYRNEYHHKLRLAADGKESMLTPPSAVKNENLYYAAMLVPGWVLWRGYNDVGTIRLFAQAIDGATAGTPKDVGEVDTWYAESTDPQIASCHSGEALTVAVKDKISWHVATVKDGAWTIPTVIPVSFDQLTCKGTESTITTLGGKDDVVRQFHCGNGVCKEAEAKLAPQSFRKVTDVDGTVIAVGRVGDRGGVHLHHAPIDGLAASQGEVLFDDQLESDSGTKIDGGWLRGLELYSAGRNALLLVMTTEGTFALRIDAAGKATPIDAEQG